jgi:hypothetical protein
MQVTRRTACAVMGESLLRQNCSHGSVCLKSRLAASKSVMGWASGEHLQYAVWRSNTSLRAASRASGSLSFNCAAASWMSGSIPYCLIPSNPWETVSKCQLTAEQLLCWDMVHNGDKPETKFQNHHCSTDLCGNKKLWLLWLTKGGWTRKDCWESSPNSSEQKKCLEGPNRFLGYHCHNKNYRQRFEATYVHKGHTSLDTELYIHIAALARTRGFRWLT